MKPLTVPEAAAFTGYTRAYLYRLVNLGKIPFHKPNGGRLFFKQDELELYLYRGGKHTNNDVAQKADDILNNMTVKK